MANNDDGDCPTNVDNHLEDRIVQGKIIHDENNIKIIQNLVGITGLNKNGNPNADGIWGDKTSLKVGEYIREAKERLGYSDNNADITPEFISSLEQDGVSADAIAALTDMKSNGHLDQIYNRSLSVPTADNGICSVENEYRDDLEIVTPPLENIQFKSSPIDNPTDNSRLVDKYMAAAVTDENAISPDEMTKIDSDITSLNITPTVVEEHSEPHIESDLNQIVHEGKVLLAEIIKSGQPIFEKDGNLTISNDDFRVRMDVVNNKILALEPDVQVKLMTEIYDQAQISINQETLAAAPTEKIVTKEIIAEENTSTPEHTEFDADKMARVMANMLGGQGVNVSGIPPENAKITEQKVETSSTSDGVLDNISDWIEEKNTVFANIYEDFTNAVAGETKSPDLTVAQNDATYEAETPPIKLG